MTVRSKAYWNAKLVTGYQITENDWIDLNDTFLLYSPATNPAVSGGVLDVDLSNSTQAVIEPTPRPITSNFTLSFSNANESRSFILILAFTGTITITFPSNVRCSNPSSLGTWEDVAKTLELTYDTNDIVEFNFMYDDSSNKYDLKVGEVAL